MDEEMKSKQQRHKKRGILPFFRLQPE